MSDKEGVMSSASASGVACGPGTEADVLREFLNWYDLRFPKGQSKRLPGLTLYMIAERARTALEPEPAGTGPEAPE